MVLEGVEMLKMRAQEINFVPAMAGSHGSMSEIDNRNKSHVAIFKYGKEFLKKEQTQSFTLGSSSGEVPSKEWELLFTKS